jgi:hypothetical protein
MQTASRQQARPHRPRPRPVLVGVQHSPGHRQPCWWVSSISGAARQGRRACWWVSSIGEHRCRSPRPPPMSVGVQHSPGHRQPCWWVSSIDAARQSRGPCWWVSSTRQHSPSSPGPPPVLVGVQHPPAHVGGCPVLGAALGAVGHNGGVYALFCLVLLGSAGLCSVWLASCSACRLPARGSRRGLTGPAVAGRPARPTRRAGFRECGRRLFLTSTAGYCCVLPWSAPLHWPRTVPQRRP